MVESTDGPTNRPPGALTDGHALVESLCCKIFLVAAKRYLPVRCDSSSDITAAISDVTTTRTSDVTAASISDVTTADTSEITAADASDIPAVTSDADV